MGKASARKKQIRESKNQETRQSQKSLSAVERLLYGTGNPLVMICIFGIVDPTMGQQIFRSVGFVCEALKDNLKLVVTCRHALCKLKQFKQSCVAMNNPNVNVVQIVGEPIEDTDLETDIAFMVVRDESNVATQPFEIAEEDPPTIIKERVLYNASAQNINPFMWVFNPLITRQHVGAEIRTAFCKMSETSTAWTSITNVDQQVKLLNEGWKQSRMFNMLSRRGFSGSPIWDDELRLYGLDIRGSSPGDGFFKELGDQLICLPTSELYRARQRIQPMLTELLAKV